MTKSLEMLKYTWISLFFLLVCSNQMLLAQDTPETSETADDELPKIKYSYKPTAIRFGTNLIRFGRTAFDTNHSSWEVTGDMDFHKYMLEVSYGRESEKLNTDGFDYENNGSFLRIGGDINFIKDKAEGNALVLGLKYVRGTYDESFKFDDSDLIFNANEAFELTNESLNSRWLEANVGMKVKMWEQLYVGFYFRYRFNRVVKGDREFGTYRIPGYGLEERRTIVGFDYYVFWRIPFKKSPKITE